MDVRLSICIVAYHDYEDVINAVNTLMAYTPSNIKKIIYIVNNSNDDESSEYQKFAMQLSGYPECRLINSKENLGFGKGHNLVIDDLNSDYHCILNPDIIFCEDVFTKILDYLDWNLDVGMVIPKLVDENGKLQLAYRKDPTVLDMFIRMFCKGLFHKRYSEHTLQFRDYSKPFYVPFAQGSFLVIRTELFRKIGGFDDGYFLYLEDADLCKRVNQCSKLMYIPYATAIHKWNKGSHKNIRLFITHLKSLVYYFNKWGWKWM